MILIVSLGIAMVGRLVVLDKGADAGTANLTFVIILGICVIAYLIILATLANAIIPWIMNKLPKREKSLPEIVVDNIPDEKENTPKQSIETIRQDSEKHHIEKQKTLSI